MSNKKPLSLFSLVMINVVAIDNLKSLTFGAQFGLSLVSYYVLAAVLFFIPVALVSAECATGWPNKGGVYVWVREALGKRWAFFVIWIMWIYNVIWYPSQMIYITGILWRWLDPTWLAHPEWVFCFSSALFVFCTVLNRFGMRFSGMVSASGAVLGTLLPMFVIILCGIYWVVSGKGSNIHFVWQDIAPSQQQNDILPFLVSIVFGLIGIEMSAIHANDVENPQKTYPRAIFISTVVIISTMLLASLSMAIILPKSQVNIIFGIVQFFDYVLSELGVNYLKPVFVFLVLWGGIANIATWIIGPSKGMMVAAQDGVIPLWFAKTNQHDVPERILWLQCVMVMVLGVGIIIYPLTTFYQMLIAISTQLALMIYVLMFLSVWVLRKRFPSQATYQVPGGLKGLFFVCLMGTLVSVMMIMLGFIAPDILEIPPEQHYTLILALGVMLFTAVPFLLARKSDESTRNSKS
ncbi:APC family permease [Gammaproteobacteria bacterium]|nr:APC family permease [Gammaproteobacteria bacterium]